MAARKSILLYYCSLLTCGTVLSRTSTTAFVHPSSILPSSAFWGSSKHKNDDKAHNLNKQFSSLNSSQMWMKKLHCPPAERNKEYIWKVLEDHVLVEIEKQTKASNKTINILEVAGGSGVHMAHFAAQLHQRYTANDTDDSREFYWQCSDPEESARESQQIYREENLTGPMQDFVSANPLSLTLDCSGIQEPDTQSSLSNDSFHLIVNINMIHISPWSATQGLMKMARQKLDVGGFLYLYGPYKVNGTTAPSNLKFDEFLQQKDPRFGVRNLEDVVELAKQEGLEKVLVQRMPANNLSVIFRRT